MSTLLKKDGPGIKYKSEMLMTTFLNFTLRVIGGKLQQRRKIVIEKPEKTIKLGDAFDIKVRCEKFAFFKDPPRPRRVFVALVNLSDNSMQIQEGSPEEPLMEK